MKHTTEELLFALQLRKLVFTRMTNDAPMGITDDAFTKWRKENLRRYLQAGIAELDMLADIIREVREEKPLPPA